NLLDSANSNLGVTGMFFNSGPYIIFTTTLFLAYLPLGIKKYNQGKYTYIIFIFTIIFLLILIVTKSRSAWFAFLLINILYLFSNKECHFVRKKLSIPLSAIILFFLSLLVTMTLYKKDSSIGRIF